MLANGEVAAALLRTPYSDVAIKNKMRLLADDRNMPWMSVLVVNQSMVDRTAQRTDITTIFVPGNEIAEETGDRRLLNMVMVGALLAAFSDIKLDEAKAALKAHLPAKHQKLVPNNFAAMDKGYAHAMAQMEKVAA